MTADGDDGGAVREVMQRYVDATFKADVAALRRTFHPEASMSGWLGDELLAGTPEPFFLDLVSRPSMADTRAPYVAEISSIEVSGRVASATLTESGFFGAMSFVNYFTLLRVDGEWMIMTKTFGSL